MFGDHLSRWGLARDGRPVVTRSSHLLPVRRDGVPAMLKVALDTEEKAGGALMASWDGGGLRGSSHMTATRSYANPSCNPDHAMATAPGRLARQIEIVSVAARLQPRRLLEWVLAWAGLPCRGIGAMAHRLSRR
jgi:streptomycin 6-kinase